MKKILLIEDDPITTRLYRFALEREGFQLLAAADGEIALKVLESDTPDLVVTDLMLPKVHGIEIIKKVRSSRATSAVPIIVLSNAFLSSMVKAAWQAGATQCLTKSDCSPEQLMEVIRQALGLPPAPPATKPPAGASEGPAPASAPAPATRATATPAVSAPGSASAPAPAAAAPLAGARRVRLPPSFLAAAAPSPPPAPAAVPEPAPKRARAQLQEAIRTTVALWGSFPAQPEPRLIQAQLLPRLRELRQLVQGEDSPSGRASWQPLPRLAHAVAGLLEELLEAVENVNPSTQRTLSLALEFLAQLLERSAELQAKPGPAPLVLAVDDEVISRRTVCSAVGLADLRAVALSDPLLALRVLEENTFEVIFLDVDMPGLNGFDLCAKLRLLPNHKTTPVVFVTGLTAFDNRARSVLSGGNDLIGKPFLLSELAAKALTIILKSQIKN